jgi:hypothetical protein
MADQTAPHLLMHHWVALRGHPIMHQHDNQPREEIQCGTLLETKAMISFSGQIRMDGLKPKRTYIRRMND